MRDSRIAGKPRGKPAAQAPAGTPIAIADQVGDLAWAGQHAEGHRAGDGALAAPRLDVATRLDLLDLRAESSIAQGDLDAARPLTPTPMFGLARTARMSAFKAQALNRQAVVQMRKGEIHTAVEMAAAALGAARRSRRTSLVATSLLRLARRSSGMTGAQRRSGLQPRPPKSSRTLGQSAGEGRALWVGSAAQSRLGHAAEAHRAAAEALVLCRSCGDCTAPAMRSTCSCRRVRSRHPAQAAESAARRLRGDGLSRTTGRRHLQPPASPTSTSGSTGEPAACDLKAAAISRARPLTPPACAAICWRRRSGEMEMGRLTAARRYLAEADAIAADAEQDRRIPYFRAMAHGRLAVLEGDPPTALPHYKYAVKRAR